MKARPCHRSFAEELVEPVVRHEIATKFAFRIRSTGSLFHVIFGLRKYDNTRKTFGETLNFTHIETEGLV